MPSCSGEECIGGASARLQLHNDGWAAFPNGRLPQWIVFEKVEQFFALHEARITLMLQEFHHRALEGAPDKPIHGGERAGARVAAMVSEIIAEDGMMVTATHAALDDKTWAVTGPRYYVSIMPAVVEQLAGGTMERPPENLARLLWPNEWEGASPHITEMGWTVVPPNSSPQQVHADIVCEERDPPFPRQDEGRFHHIAWKADHKSTCTTQLIYGAFTEGATAPEHYDQIVSVIGAAVVIDSEVLHRGAQSKNRWSATCTVQLCSSTGWHALCCGHRVSPDLLELTAAIAAPAQCASKKRTRIDEWRVGAPVEVLFKDEWKEAVLERFHSDGTYQVLWVDGNKYSGSFCTGVSASNIRLQGGAVALESHQESGMGWKPDGHRKLHSLLVSRGWVCSHQGLQWAWELFDFVERMHAEHHEKIEQLLEARRPGWGAEPSRWGNAACTEVSAELQPLGIAVYCPPSSQEQAPPFENTGPRFYVSVTQAALKQWPDGVPAMPEALLNIMWPEKPDQDIRIRGAGWALAPADSPPQTLHADIWGEGMHSKKGGKVRYPHILWKSDKKSVCTTEVVSGGFCMGCPSDYDYRQLNQVNSSCVLIDSECLHRGAAVSAKCQGGWASSCSVEFCSSLGWAAWEQHDTGGTVLPGPEVPEEQEQYRMLLVQH